MKLQISPEVRRDLLDIKDYIANDLENPAAAQNTVSKIMKSIRVLVGFPDSGAPLSSILDIQTNYRFLVSGNYLVFYRHEGDIVYIVRVLFAGRDYMKILFP